MNGKLFQKSRDIANPGATPLGGRSFFSDLLFDAGLCFPRAGGVERRKAPLNDASFAVCAEADHLWAQVSRPVRAGSSLTL
jgi:hypothetical protein